MREESEKKGVDLSPCARIANKIRRNMAELIGLTTNCVTDKISKVTKDIEPLKAKFNETNEVLLNFLKDTSKCVNESKNSAMKDLACLADVSISFKFSLSYTTKNFFFRKM